MLHQKNCAFWGDIDSISLKNPDENDKISMSKKVAGASLISDN